MADMGWRVTPVFWRRKKVDDAGKPAPYAVELDAPLNSPRLLLRIPSLWRGLWKLLDELSPTLILAGHLCLLPVALAWSHAKGTGRVWVVYDALEYFPLELSFYFGRLHRVAAPLLRMAENLGAALSSAVLTVDSRAGHVERRLKRWNKRITVIWNVPSLGENPSEEQVKRLADDYRGRRVIAFVGGLMKAKGFFVALETAALVKTVHDDAVFLFIGAMKEDREVVRALVRDLNIEHCTRFIEHIPYTEMLAHLRHCSIGLALHQKARVYPYVSAGNGRKFFTYMQAGIPVIGPKFGEVGEIVRLTDCGMLVDTTRPEAVAEAIRTLFKNPREARRLGQNGQRALTNVFNWERESVRLKRVLRDLTN